MQNKPLCFVLMPFGRKPSGGGRLIDFDSVYRDVIHCAVEAAGLRPLRADEEEAGGIIHKSMFERLVLCEYAVADLTTANANVFYELGVRHAVKPKTTILLYADGVGRLPFDVAPLRALSYPITPEGRPKCAKESRHKLTKRIQASKSGNDSDSPLYQLLDDYPNVAHEKTDIFRERVAYEEKIKEELFRARLRGREDLLDVEKSLGEIDDLETGVVVDLFLSYRAVKAWNDMIRVAKKMNPVLRQTVLVREQLGFALNRAGRGEDAERVLLDLINDRGPSSETLGILGRVYKDRWELARTQGSKSLAEGLLRKVVDTYLRGFETDWRDAYPGVNVLTFLRILDPKNDEYDVLRPVVGYAVKRKMSASIPDYWDYATCLELCVLDGDKGGAKKALADALGAQREPWESETTLRNIRMIREAKDEVSDSESWIRQIETELEKTLN